MEHNILLISVLCFLQASRGKGIAATDITTLLTLCQADNFIPTSERPSTIIIGIYVGYLVFLDIIFIQTVRFIV